MKTPADASPELQSLLYNLMEKGYGILRHAQNEGVSEILPGLGITLFRNGRHQIQQFIFRPNSEIIEHSHPNVESVEVYVCGDMELTLNGEVVFSYTDCIDLPDGRCPKNGGMLYLPKGAVHGGKIGPRGGCFLSVQVWEEGCEPKPIHLDWKAEDGSLKG